MAIRQFNVFVEGHDDHDLVVALLRQRLSVDFDPTRKRERTATYLRLAPEGDVVLVLATKGWTELAKSETAFRQAQDSGGQNLVVFDADYDQAKYPEGGQAKRAAAIRSAVAAFAQHFAIFLFPQPAQDGDLETLLLQLTQPAHQRVMDCYDAYELCLRQFLGADGTPYYDAPSKKRRIYDYVNVMPLQGEEWERHHEKGGQKIFENSDLWNLDAPAIQPLRAFLDLHIR